MKKVVAWLLSVMVAACALVACGGSHDETTTGYQLENPVHTCTQEEMTQETGISIDAPEGAENVQYSYIEDTALIAQVTYTLNGIEMCYRAESTGARSIMSGIDDSEATLETITEDISNQINIGAELSGMYYDWECAGTTVVGNSHDAVFGFNTGHQGFISWLDNDKGILYSISMTDGCSQQVLEDTANTACSTLNK